MQIEEAIAEYRDEDVGDPHGLGWAVRHIRVRVLDRILGALKRDCWIWDGPCSDGPDYRQPQIKLFGKIWYVTHVVAFAWMGERGLKGKSVYRTCGHYDCVKPGHLKVGTNADAQRHRAYRGGAVKGVENGRSVLTEDDVRDIRKLIKKRHLFLTEIASEYLVSVRTVTKIRDGLTWTHVE